MTTDEIAEKLGFMPPRQWAEKRPHGSPGGLTTAMLIDALSAISRGADIRIVAYSAHYGRQLLDQLLDMAERVGLGPEAASRVRQPTSFYFRMMRRESEMAKDWLDFDDHFRP